MNRRDSFEHGEPVKLWHLYVEEDEIRLELRDPVHGVFAIPCLAHDIEGGVRLKQ